MLRTSAGARRAIAGLTVAAVVVTLNASPAAVPAPPGHCNEAGYREFDFWLGEWDVFDVAAPKTSSARVSVASILDGCALRESYEGARGLKGQSISSYDSAGRVWQQTWVTNRGELLVLHGTFRGSEMVLEGADVTADGRPRLVKGVWKPAGEGVEETAVISLDDGKTWATWFDLIFRPHDR